MTVKIDETRMQERPEGVSEEQWRAKLVYEAVQAGQAPEDTVRTNDDAKRAAEASLVAGKSKAKQ